jgi:hypothetical protein
VKRVTHKSQPELDLRRVRKRANRVTERTKVDKPTIPKQRCLLSTLRTLFEQRKEPCQGTLAGAVLSDKDIYGFQIEPACVF